MEFNNRAQKIWTKGSSIEAYKIESSANFIQMYNKNRKQWYANFESGQ